MVELKRINKGKNARWMVTALDPMERAFIRSYGKKIRGEPLGFLGIFKYKKNAEKVIKKVKEVI